MTGLLLKDLLNLKQLAKQYLLIFAVMVVWAYFMKSGAFISMYGVLCTAMMVLTSFSYDEYANFDKYALTMPITRKELVKEKYLLLVILVGFGTVLGILLGAGMNLVLGEDLGEMVVTGLVIGCVFFVVYCMIIPVIYKVSLEKARMTMVIIYLGLFVAIYGMVELVSAGNGLEGIRHLEVIIPAGAVIAALIIFMGSFYISLQIVEKKEW